MSSNLLSTVANYSGRQSDNQQSVKQFVTSITNQVVWFYKRLINGKTVITTDKNKDVLIQKDLYVNGSIYNPSDEMLKRNIVPICDERLFELNPVHFQYKDDYDKKIHNGLIAQEVEKIYPELVSSNIMGYKNVNYIELIPIMLSKMKKTQTELDELKSFLIEKSNEQSNEI